jgi:hypothetical protein
MRLVLELVDEYTQAGILFVPVPATSQKDAIALQEVAMNRLNMLTEEAEKNESKTD